jgi:hypothetical protein
MGGMPPSLCAMSFAFLCEPFQSFQLGVSPHLAWGWKKVEGTPARKKNRRAGCGRAGGKIRRCDSLNHMKIIVDLAELTCDQVKLLSQMGEFRDDQTWEAACDPSEFQEAVNLLKRAGIEDVFVQFGS